MLLLLVGCTTPQADRVPTVVVPTATALPPAAITCADMEAAWGQDWQFVIHALVTLRQQELSCGAEPLASKLYAARFNYAAVLEAQGNVPGAVAHLEAAYALDPMRTEALDALERLGHLPNPPEPYCEGPIPSIATVSDVIPATPNEVPPGTTFVTVADRELRWNDQPLVIRGVNYYPRHAPWNRFIPEAEPTEMAAELDLIQAAGFNTIRIFLHYDALFQCEPELAFANAEGFATVDTLLQLARERGLWVMVTLNDLPDLRFRPLYTDWGRYDTQTIYIVNRYRYESTIIAWDLRNEGDLDYGARTGDTARFTPQEVIDWLAHISALVRNHDPNHLITAGWWGDPAATEPYMDILSFHHWSNAEELASRIEQYQATTTKPLLLQEIGYHSWADAPTDARTEEAQADLLAAATTTADANGLAGWLIWNAFDYEPIAEQPANYEHFFGLWRVDGSEKPALNALPLQ